MKKSVIHWMIRLIPVLAFLLTIVAFQNCGGPLPGAKFGSSSGGSTCPFCPGGSGGPSGDFIGLYGLLTKCDGIVKSVGTNNSPFAINYSLSFLSVFLNATYVYEGALAGGVVITQTANSRSVRLISGAIVNAKLENGIYTLEENLGGAVNQRVTSNPDCTIVTNDIYDDHQVLAEETHDTLQNGTISGTISDFTSDKSQRSYAFNVSAKSGQGTYKRFRTDGSLANTYSWTEAMKGTCHDVRVSCVPAAESCDNSTIAMYQNICP